MIVGGVQMKTTVTCPYLEGEGPEQVGAYLRHFGLYESRDLTHGRSILGLSLPVESRYGLSIYWTCCSCVDISSAINGDVGTL